jgi:hypothetical protein
LNETWNGKINNVYNISVGEYGENHGNSQLEEPLEAEA